MLFTSSSAQLFGIHCETKVHLQRFQYFNAQILTLRLEKNCLVGSKAQVDLPEWRDLHSGPSHAVNKSLEKMSERIVL